MGCLEENQVVALLDGSASVELAHGGRQHVSTCEPCRALLAATARALFEPSRTPGGWLEDVDGLRNGTKLGAYEILERVGRGGMGIVYAARDLRLGRKVAVKLLHSGTDETIDRLRAEAKILASLSHANVVEIYDVGTSEHGPYVAMEFVDGGDLWSWLGSPRTLTEQLDVLAQAGRGLAAAHAAGIVHRDFKPHNVLVGRDGRVRVVDFGLAAAQPGVHEPTDPLDAAASVVGTPGYLAPEQLEGLPVDGRADQFSFCVVAVVVLSGATAVPKAALPDPGSHRRLAARALSGLPTALRKAILRGLEPDPGRRFASMDRLLAAMQPRRRRWIFGVVAGAAALGLAWLRPGFGPELERSPDDATLVDGPADQSALESEFERVYAELHAARELGVWTELGPGLTEQVDALQARARARGDAAIEAKVGLLRGTIAMWELRFDDARSLFEAAYLRAEWASEPDAAFEAARFLVILHHHGGDPKGPERVRWSELAGGAALRSDRASTWSRWLALDAEIVRSQGDLDGAIARYDEAETLLDEHDPVSTWDELLTHRGQALLAAGRPDAALEDFTQALARMERGATEDSMELVPALNGTGTALRMLGWLSEAAEALERVRDIVARQETSGPNIAAVRGNLAQVYADMGRLDDALAEFEVVRDLFEAVVGPAHPATVQTSAVIASILQRLDRCEAANRNAFEALRWSVGVEHRGAVLAILTECHARLGDRWGAWAWAQAVLADPASNDEQRQAGSDVLRNAVRAKPR